MQVNGPQTSDHAVPFRFGDMYMAAPGELTVPTDSQQATLHEIVGDNRVALVCNPESAGGFCAGHLLEMWRLRGVDGYYGIGVPSRLRALPWGSSVASLRSISFITEDDLPWPLLGFLNVGVALAVDETGAANPRGGLALDAASFRPISNPAAVVPRAFMPRAVEPVAGPDEAIAALFHDGVPSDVGDVSFVEGIDQPERLVGQAEVPVSGGGDRLDFDVSASQGERVLVANELYFPGWTAFVDGVETPLLAANAVMRAVRLPPDAKKVTMVYRPFVRSDVARILYLAGALLFLAGLAIAFGIQRAAVRGRRVVRA